MNGLERTLGFLRGESVDHPPFHPIVMRWAARHAGVNYREFCLDPGTKTGAMLKAADDFGMDWVTVMSDPWTEAEAFGIQVEYPGDSLPIDRGGHFPDAASVAALQPYKPLEHRRCRNRIEEIRLLRQQAGNRLFIVGWVEGPVAAYADLRGVSEAALDFLDEPEACLKAMDVIVASAIDFITCQVEAGAHCIGIGDAFCSQIGPELYRQMAFDGEKRIIEHIHSLGAIAKLHICGNTAPILDQMIATGADILDVDHLVPDMGAFAGLLAPNQFFSGKTDPVTMIQNGTPEQIRASVEMCRQEGKNRVIKSAGCEITPGTTDDNMRAFSQS
jgi:uroporphyrinogen decarboxylase